MESFLRSAAASPFSKLIYFDALTQFFRSDVRGMAVDPTRTKATKPAIYKIFYPEVNIGCERKTEWHTIFVCHRVYKKILFNQHGKTLVTHPLAYCTGCACVLFPNVMLTSTTTRNQSTCSESQLYYGIHHAALDGWNIQVAPLADPEVAKEQWIHMCCEFTRLSSTTSQPGRGNGVN